MIRMARLFVVVVGVMVLAGCFQVDQVVTVSPDGSGTVEETFMISRKVSESLAALTGGGEERHSDAASKKKKKKAAKPASFFKDDEIRARAAKMGEGVRFMRMKRVATKDFEGYTALFAFKDINRLRLEQSGGGAPGGEAKDAGTKGVQFLFIPGPTATLMVKQAKKSAEAQPDQSPAAVDASAPPASEAPAEASEKDLEMLRQMFAGMRIGIKIVVKGIIEETNATHRTNSTITVADIDFGALLDKPELLTRLSSIPPGDSEVAMAAFKKIPGMKVDMNDELRIRFR